MNAQEFIVEVRRRRREATREIAMFYARLALGPPGDAAADVEARRLLDEATDAEVAEFVRDMVLA